MSAYDYNGNVTQGVYDINGNNICYPETGRYITDPIYKQLNNKQYRLVWRDEFDENDLNKNAWTDYYFVDGARKRYKAQSDYYLGDGKLHIRIQKDAPARYDNAETDIAISSVQTGASNKYRTSTGHNYNINPFWGLITQEGYYECRFKIYRATGGNHIAWWGTGLTDGNIAKGEIDIAEILCHQSTKLPHGQHQIEDTSITEVYRTTSVNVDFADDYHTVGFLWENGTYKWYVDGELVDTITAQTMQYPIIHILSAYKTRSGSSWTGDADPELNTKDVEFTIEYLRIYKPSESVSISNVVVNSVTPITINGLNSDMTIDDDRGCPSAFPSYVCVNWSDGSRTEHWIKWDAYRETFQSKMTNHQSFDWPGYVYELGISATANVIY